MEVINTPIVDFYKYCLDSAEKRGFVWVLCLLSREADSEKAYMQIKRYWESIGDLTGETILFIFAGAKKEHGNKDSMLFDEEISYRAIYNDSLRIVNTSDLTLPSNSLQGKYQRTDFSEITVNHTNSISDLRDYFKLTEKDVPSLIFTPTNNFFRERHLAISIKHEKVYSVIKNVIEEISEPLKEYNRNREIVKIDNESLNRRCRDIESTIKQYKKDILIESDFIKSENYIVGMIENIKDKNMKKKLIQIMKNKDEKSCYYLDKPTCGKLIRYIKLYNQYMTAKSFINSSKLKITNLEEKKDELQLEIERNLNNLRDSYKNVEKVIESIGKRNCIESKEEFDPMCYDEYDVAFSFAGEDREYIEEVAEILREKSIRIFYDLYEKSRLWGKDLYIHLNDIYSNKAKYCVMFISKNYKNKLWPRHEMRSAFERAFKSNNEYILPARFDDTKILGIRDTTGYIDLRKMEPSEFASLIVEKLAENSENE